MKALDAEAAAAAAPVQSSVRLDMYYRMARGLAMQAECYYDAGKRAEAYVFYRRLANLCLKGLTAHTAYGMKQYAADLAWSRRAAELALTRVAELKPLLLEAYARTAPAAPPALPSPPPPTTRSTAAASGAAAAGGPTPERAAALAAAGPTGAPSGTGGGPAAAAAAEDGAVAARIAALGLGGSPSGAEAASGACATAPRATAHAYPSAGGGGGGGAAGGLPPPSAATSGLYGGVITPAGAPEAERANRARRRISVPVGILEAFMAIADSNTRRGEYGVETCGVLCGTVTPAGELFVSHLLVPKQTGTSDTCAMTNEEELFEYCMARSLLTLGWIHTHPRQSCFMSSMDVHTHCGYQTMLPVRACRWHCHSLRPLSTARGACVCTRVVTRVTAGGDRDRDGPV